MTGSIRPTYRCFSLVSLAEQYASPWWVLIQNEYAVLLAPKVVSFPQYYRILVAERMHPSLLCFSPDFCVRLKWCSVRSSQTWTITTSSISGKTCSYMRHSLTCAILRGHIYGTFVSSITTMVKRMHTRVPLPVRDGFLLFEQASCACKRTVIYAVTGCLSYGIYKHTIYVLWEVHQG